MWCCSLAEQIRGGRRRGAERGGFRMRRWRVTFCGEIEEKGGGWLTPNSPSPHA